MSEGSFQPENKENKFMRSDLTPFEHLMIGSTSEVDIGGGDKLIINCSNFLEMARTEQGRKVLFSPISLMEGKKGLEEVKVARAKGEKFVGFLSIFEIDPLLKYMKENINPTFMPGVLDQNGQLTSFNVFFMRGKDRIDPSRKMLEELVLGNGFDNVVERCEVKDGIINFKIKNISNN